jgi:hypothetical protein
MGLGSLLTLGNSPGSAAFLLPTPAGCRCWRLVYRGAITR